MVSRSNMVGTTKLFYEFIYRKNKTILWLISNFCFPYLGEKYLLYESFVMQTELGVGKQFHRNVLNWCFLIARWVDRSEGI